MELLQELLNQLNFIKLNNSYEIDGNNYDEGYKDGKNEGLDIAISLINDKLKKQIFYQEG